MTGTPYVTPQMLIDAPFGISWATIPRPGASEAEQLAEQTNIAERATALVDEYCNQPLRATLDVETVFGPDFRVTCEPNGTAHATLSRFPIISLLGGRCSPAEAFPAQWRTIDASMMRVDEALMPLAGTDSVAGAAGAGPSGIYIAPGYVDGCYGRRGYMLEVTYINGWPHAGLTADASSAATTIDVDDVTGFTGAIAKIYDSGDTETVTVTAISSVNGQGSGPGTLTLAAPLAYAHAKGVMISTLPGSVQQATMLYAADLALERGSTAIVIPDMPGAEVSSTAPNFASEAEILIHAYKRVI